MSALGHYLEEEGLATTIIGLVREHSARIKPPRTLWVKYELGRPLGGPNDTATQRRVLESALALFESDAGPGLLVDDDTDDAGTDPDPLWRNPVSVTPRTFDPNDVDDIRAKLAAEIAEVEPVYLRRLNATGRTTIGYTGLGIHEIVPYVTSFLTDTPEESPHPDMSRNLAMRFASDDLKAFYLEAAMFGGGNPSTLQLGAWLWKETVVGQMLIVLRARALQSEDKSFQRVGQTFLVPRTWVELLDL